MVDSYGSVRSVYTGRIGHVTFGAGFDRLSGYPFEVRYSQGALQRARMSADVAADAYRYLRGLFSEFAPDIALIVASKADWSSTQPYGMPYFNDDQGQIRPGILVMPSEQGVFWTAMANDIGGVSGSGYAKLLATYANGAGDLDLQPFFDLVTIHELGHAFEVLGGLRLPTFWLGEIFANLALHTFVATRRPRNLATLEVLPTVGVEDELFTMQIRAEGSHTLEDFESHYAGSSQQMSSRNYVWYQYRFLRLAAKIFAVDGEGGLVRFWECFRGRVGRSLNESTIPSIARLLTTEVSETLGDAVENWREW
ncbi:MAG: hypothetical protein ACP5HZ_08675 [Ferrimicrobium sp.]